MKPLLSLMLLVLLLGLWAWGLATGGQVPEVLLRTRCDAASCSTAGASPGACESSQKYQVKPGSETPWILVYVPVRSCQRVLKDKHGEFSPPAHHSDSPLNFWCDWTIRAGSRKHIIVYIQGFVTEEDCNKNEDKILFEGVSSLVENSVVYACWKKQTHVFATFAQAVRVVLLKRYLPGCRDTQFKGTYYIFPGEGEASSEPDDTISETLAPKLPKRDRILQSGWSENLSDVLGFAAARGTTSLGETGGLSGDLMQQRDVARGTMVVGSPVDLDPYERGRTPLLETEARSVLGTELPGDLRYWQEAQGRTAEGIIPTAVQRGWRQSLPVSEDSAVGLGRTRRLPSALLETPLLSAWRVAEAFVQPAGGGLENSQSVLHPSLRPKDLDNLQLTIKPTHTSFLDLAAHSQPLFPGRKDDKKSAGTTTYQGLSTVSLEKGGSHPPLSTPCTAGSDADGRAKALMPSLSSLYEAVNRDHSHPLPERYQSSFGDLSMTQPELGTAGVPPPEGTPLSSIALSPLAALDLDPMSLKRRAGISLSSPGGQEMVSPLLPHHSSVASELGADESRGRLGPEIQKLALGGASQQVGEALAPVDSPAGGPSPASVTSAKPGVGFLRPENHVNSGSRVTQASLPGTWAARREEHAVPVQHQATASSNKLASAPVLGGFKIQKTTETLSVGAGEQGNASSSATPAHSASSVAWWGETVLRGQKHQKPSDDPVSGNTQMPGGQQQSNAGAELGLPWTMEYFPIRSCHAVFQNGSGVFYLPLHVDIKTNIWCNWTILAGSQKHILIYVQGFQGSDGCSKNQDKIIFQGVLSSVETKVVYACHHRGTLIFAAQAAAVHVLFLSGSGSLSHEYRHFKGRYYVFRGSETLGSSTDTVDLQEPVQEVSKQSWRAAVTRGLLPMLGASSGRSDDADGRIQPELESPDEEVQHPPDLVENAQSSANLSKHDLNECDQPQDETELERSLKEDSAEDRETKDDMLVEPSPAGQDAGHKAELSALEIAKGDVQLLSALVTIAPCRSVGVPASEMASSSEGLSAKSSHLDEAGDSLSEEAFTAHPMQSPVLEEPPLNKSTKPSPLSPAPGVAAGDVVSPGEWREELFDLTSLENGTVLQSQHHPGDVLFEVTIEIKPKDWISHVGSERHKSLLESVKKHIQENLKLSANRVSDVKLKEIRRLSPAHGTSDANLLLTFWLHLKPEERNVSLLLRSQLEELLGTSVGEEKLQLVSLFVEDVNECSTGVGLCGEEAECFNSVGTYLCRCKKDYEDHSPTKSGTHCIHVPRSGTGFFLRHADILVGAAIMGALAMLVAAGTMCRVAKWRRRPRRNPSPEEPPVRAAEEPVMQLHDLGECLRLDPFQLKLRARPPEWLWRARAHPDQAYRVFLEQSHSL